MFTLDKNRVPRTNSRLTDEHRPTNKQLKRRPDQTIQSNPSVGEMLRVLIVDGCQDTVDSMSTLVEIWGYEVAKACDTITALDKASSFRPHVLLLDIAMPGMTGFHLASLMRQLAYLRNALLVAITGSTRAEQRHLCQRTGFDYFFLKPLLPTIVERLLFLEQERLANTNIGENFYSRQIDQNLQRLELRAMIGACIGASCFQALS